MSEKAPEGGILDTSFSYFKQGISKSSIPSGVFTLWEYLEIVTGKRDFFPGRHPLKNRIEVVRKVHDLEAQGLPLPEKWGDLTYRDFKEALPWCFFQGEIVRRRKPSNNERWKDVGFEPSRLLCLDVDGKDNHSAPFTQDSFLVHGPEDTSLEALKERAEVIKELLVTKGPSWIVAVIMSPSGVGYKVICEVPPYPLDDIAMSRAIQRKMAEELLETCGIVIDDAVKAGWASFMCYDEEAWINPAPRCIDIDENLVREERERWKKSQADLPDIGKADPDAVKAAVNAWLWGGCKRGNETFRHADGLLHHGVHERIVWGVVHAVGPDEAEDLLEDIGFADHCSASFNLKKIIRDYSTQGETFNPITWESLSWTYGVASWGPELDVVEVDDPPPPPFNSKEAHEDAFEPDYSQVSWDDPGTPEGPAWEDAPPEPEEPVWEDPDEGGKEFTYETHVDEETGEEYEEPVGPEDPIMEDPDGGDPSQEFYEDEDGDGVATEPGVFHDDGGPVYKNPVYDKIMREFWAGPGDAYYRYVETKQGTRALTYTTGRFKAHMHVEGVENVNRQKRIIADITRYKSVGCLAPILFQPPGTYMSSDKMIVLNSCELTRPRVLPAKCKPVKWGQGFPKVAKFFQVAARGPLSVQDRILEREISYMSHQYRCAVDQKPQKGPGLIGAGEAGIGKTFKWKVIYGQMLLGGWAKADEFFQDTDRNTTIAVMRSPIALLDDPDRPTSAIVRKKIADRIKNFISSGEGRFRKMQTDSLTLSTKGHRVIMLCNTTPSAMEALPELDKSMTDKLVKLHYRGREIIRNGKKIPVNELGEEIPIPTDEEIEKELPYFANFLYHYRIPEDLQHRRFGLICFASDIFREEEGEDDDVDATYRIFDNLLDEVMDGALEAWSEVPERRLKILSESFGFYKGVHSDGKLWFVATKGGLIDYMRAQNRYLGNREIRDLRRNMRKVMSSESAVIFAPGDVSPKDVRSRSLRLRCRRTPEEICQKGGDRRNQGKQGEGYRVQVAYAVDVEKFFRIVRGEIPERIQNILD